MHHSTLRIESTLCPSNSEHSCILLTDHLSFTCLLLQSDFQLSNKRLYAWTHNLSSYYGVRRWAALYQRRRACAHSATDDLDSSGDVHTAKPVGGRPSGYRRLLCCSFFLFTMDSDFLHVFRTSFAIARRVYRKWGFGTGGLF